MFCEYCGAKLPEGAKTCPMCGSAQERRGAGASSGQAKGQPGRDTTYRRPETESRERATHPGDGRSDRYARPDYHYEYEESPYRRTSHSEYQAPPSSKGQEGFAIASLVVGIVGLVISCCLPRVSLPLAIIAIVAGVFSVIKKRGGRGMAFAGIVLGAVTLILSIVWMAVGALFLSIFRDVF